MNLSPAWTECVSCISKEVRVEIEDWLFYNNPIMLKPYPIICPGQEEISVLQKKNLDFWEEWVLSLSKSNSPMYLVCCNSHTWNIEPSATLGSQTNFPFLQWSSQMYLCGAHPASEVPLKVLLGKWHVAGYKTVVKLHTLFLLTAKALS